MNLTLLEILLVIIIVLLTIAIIAIIKTYKRLKIMLAKQTPINKSDENILTCLDYIKEVISKIKESDIYKSETKNSFLEGKIQGEKETLEKFEIHYEPFIESDEKWFTKKINSGYYMTIYFSGMPISDRMQKFINKDYKVKQEEINKVKATIDNLIELAIAIFAKKGINAKKVV